MTNFWLKLKRPFVVLAPMEGVTNFDFREMMCDLGKPDIFFTEFVNVDGLVASEKVRERLKFSLRQKPIVAQIWGTNLTNFEKAAKLIEKMGFDGIDINMGCPVKKALKLGGGAALINNRELAKSIIEAVKSATKLPVSVKTRLGDGWTEFLLEQKLAALTIHARTPKQMSQGMADWNKIGEAVKLAINTAIIGNGDVTCYAEVLEKHKIYGVDGVMIGRGVFNNPLIFTKTEKQLTKEEKLFYFNKYNQRMFLKGFLGAKEMRIQAATSQNFASA